MHHMVLQLETALKILSDKGLQQSQELACMIRPSEATEWFEADYLRVAK